MPCLTFSDLTLGYAGHPAVRHLSGSVAKGSLTAIVGGSRYIDLIRTNVSTITAVAAAD